MEENTEVEIAENSEVPSKEDIPQSINDNLKRNKDGSIRLSRHNELLLGKKLRKEFVMTPAKKANLDKIRAKSITVMKERKEALLEKQKKDTIKDEESIEETIERHDNQNIVKETVMKDEQPIEIPKKNRIVNRDGYFYMNFE